MSGSSRSESAIYGDFVSNQNKQETAKTRQYTINKNSINKLTRITFINIVTVKMFITLLYFNEKYSHARGKDR